MAMDNAHYNIPVSLFKRSFYYFFFEKWSIFFSAISDGTGKMCAISTLPNAYLMNLKNNLTFIADINIYWILDKTRGMYRFFYFLQRRVFSFLQTIV